MLGFRKASLGKMLKAGRVYYGRNSRFCYFSEV